MERDEVPIMQADKTAIKTYWRVIGRYPRIARIKLNRCLLLKAILRYNKGE